MLNEAKPQYIERAYIYTVAKLSSPKPISGGWGQGRGQKIIMKKYQISTVYPL